MKEIPLTQGKVALVDDEDFEYLNQWKWYALKTGNTYYVRTAIYPKGEKGKQKLIQMHRLIMKPPDHLEIDHINRNALDNQKHNLRFSTRRDNCCNTCKNSKYIGVQKHRNKYQAKINFNGNEYKFLGMFKTPEEAHNAYLKAKNIIDLKEYQNE